MDIVMILNCIGYGYSKWFWIVLDMDRVMILNCVGWILVCGILEILEECVVFVKYLLIMSDLSGLRMFLVMILNLLFSVWEI